ncbi:dematin isoform X1 [Corythoichthys intestinalis]|uniref:dematin isoform X1 n=1 Tax=Corythoichthys intestinalis TaxID=161448 RepID=UPI0025A5A338|nr:dematin isoform X1 [Corythoichthys intestinalis]XP_057675114.1 dematin isoform X1 [Corythoichthys intestinalis]XP_057675115.1 dematin isoform X1 [Corythoichthys intestinalis]
MDKSRAVADVDAVSLRGPGASTPILARADERVAAYRDLAALPRDKAILEVERPDLMTYRPHLSFSPLDGPRRQRSLSPPAVSPASSPEAKGRRAESESGSPGGSVLQLQSTGRKMSASLQHFHRPDNGTNIYRKPPIYKQGSKPAADGVVQAAKFPAAQPPDPDQPSKIETDFWPCPPSLASMEIEWRRKKAEEEEDDDDFEDLTAEAKALQEQELEKIKSNLGRLILREEKEKGGGDFRRKTRSLPDRTHAHSSLSANASKSPSRSNSGLSRVRSSPSLSMPSSPIGCHHFLLFPFPAGFRRLLFVPLTNHLRFDAVGQTPSLPEAVGRVFR